MRQTALYDLVGPAAHPKDGRHAILPSGTDWGSCLVSPGAPGKPRRAFGALRPLEILALLCETADILRGLQ